MTHPFPISVSKLPLEIFTERVDAHQLEGVGPPAVVAEDCEARLVGRERLFIRKTRIGGLLADGGHSPPFSRHGGGLSIRWTAVGLEALKEHASMRL